LKQETATIAGIDIGAATAKAVILRGSEMLAYTVIPTGHSVSRASDEVMRVTLEKCGLSQDKLEYIVATGYGRRSVTFANKVLTEIICHAAGVVSVMPLVRTVIDIGGQDSKVIGLDSNGKVGNFVMNDKCAAGTGRFLEVMARVLEVDISEMGPSSLGADAPCQISSTCTVFAESEMVSLRAENKSRENIIAGIHRAMAHRIAVMGKSVGFIEQIVLTGGVAKNTGIIKSLRDEIGMAISIPPEPQIIGALGAAVLAREELARI
jgi:(R)-2-hydroxyacyl-CoA dehydratese activating ATPase